MTGRDEGYLRLVAARASAVSDSLVPIASLIHRVGSVLPEDQAIVDVSPDDAVGDALALMAEHGFSQLPVRSGSEVLGVFSHRSFARQASMAVKRMPRTSIDDMPVEEFLEPAVFVTIHDELHDVFDLLDARDCVFVGDEQQLQGVLTSVDALRWLHSVAEPFVRLGEIERSLRSIVGFLLTAEEVAAFAQRALKCVYAKRPEDLPIRLVDMTLNELRLVVVNGENWKLIEPALGRNREAVSARLADLPDLRNDLFHFRRSLNESDLLKIAEARNWLLRRHRTLTGSGAYASR